jgi:hypothetical protein
MNGFFLIGLYLNLSLKIDFFRLLTHYSTFSVFQHSNKLHAYNCEIEQREPVCVWFVGVGVINFEP